jgi:quercetin dioxygenase-like cupin family protein
VNTATVIRELCPAAACCLLAVALPFLASQANAQAPGKEPALARTPDDAGLQWGPCPEFLPAGCGIAVLHGDPAQPNVDVLLKLPGKSQIPLHTHTSAERMVLVSGELRVSYEGQAPAQLTPGTYAYGPAGRAHSGACVSEAPCVLFIAFESALDAMPSGAGNP